MGNFSGNYPSGGTDGPKRPILLELEFVRGRKGPRKLGPQALLQAPPTQRPGVVSLFRHSVPLFPGQSPT